MSIGTLSAVFSFFFLGYVFGRRELDRHHPHEKYHITVMYNQNMTTAGWSDLGRETWEWAPPGRGGSTIWYKEDALYIFGGRTKHDLQFNDMWRFNLNNRRWTWLKGKGGSNGIEICRDKFKMCRFFENENTPSARFYAAGYALPGKEGSLILLGGEATFLNRYYIFNDVWEFDIVIMKWRRVFDDTTTSVSDISHYGDVLNRRYSQKFHPHKFTGATFFQQDDHFGEGTGLGYVSKVMVDGEIHAVNEVWRVFTNEFSTSTYKFEWGWQNVFDNITCNYDSYIREGVGCPPARFYPHVWLTQVEFNQTYMWVFGGINFYHNTFLWEYQDLWRWKGSWNYISGPKFGGMGEQMKFMYRYNETNFPGGHAHGGVWANEVPELEKVYLHIFGGVGPKNQGSLDVWTFWYDLESHVQFHHDKKYHRAITWKKSYVAERMNITRFLPAVVGGKLPWPKYQWAGYFFGGVTADGTGLRDLVAYTRWDIECYGINWDDTKDVCGGNRGECIANDLCLCDHGFYGVKCDYEKPIPNFLQIGTIVGICVAQGLIIIMIFIVSFLVYFVGIKKYNLSWKLVLTIGVLEFLSSEERKRKGLVYKKNYNEVKKKYREKYKQETGIRNILKELEDEKVTERDEKRESRKRKKIMKKKRKERLKLKKTKKKKKITNNKNKKKKRFSLGFKRKKSKIGKKKRNIKKKRRRKK